jgi:hypothetical protein
MTTEIFNTSVNDQDEKNQGSSTDEIKVIDQRNFNLL